MSKEMGIISIKGVSSAHAAKLKEEKIKTTEELLKIAGSRQGRKELAYRTGISEELILKWVTQADLMRIKGIGEEYSDLLEVAGVFTVKELAIRHPQNLHQSIKEVNAKQKLVRRPPTLSQVQRWV